MRIYIDSSAAAKLFVDEAESDLLAAFCDRPEVEMVATDLLETELRRLAHRDGYPQADVTEVLDRVELHALARSVYRDAGVIDGKHLRSLDALHLAGASRLDVDAILVYDRTMSDAAIGLGFTVLQPGVPDER